MDFVKALTELGRSDLLVAGGKGANLGALLAAGLPVPGGFVITTAGYRAFVEANALDADLRRVLAATRMDDPASLDAAADQIEGCFRRASIPPDLAAAIRQAYGALADVPLAVAVRSSATAEDLPDLSFAGQQDTYLNILGVEALLESVVRCWASLWTARAIGYRARNAISHDDVALAVIVQQMVQSEVAGVLFTANPLSGKRDETVIEATFGLGEALVSGQVEPDSYVVETAAVRILSKTLGAKALAIQGQPEGGTLVVEQDRGQQQALPDEQILALTRLGQQAAVNFGAPQDLEWAWAGGNLYVLQSRPITTLYPLPENTAGERASVWFSFAVWQGMLEPYTPLGQDNFNALAAGVGGLFGIEVDPDGPRTIVAAGERLFVNMSGLLRNSIGRQVLGVFLSAVDPASVEIFAVLFADPRFAETGGLSLRNGWHLIGGLFPFAKNIGLNLLFPRWGRTRFQRIIDEQLALTRAQCAAAKDLSELLPVFDDKSVRMVRRLFPALVAGIAAGQGIALQSLLRMAAKVPQGAELAMELTRGLPHNVTTEMDLALWAVAQALRVEPALAELFAVTPTAVLVADYHSGQLPSTAQAAISGFLTRYGLRCIGEIDLGRPRWNDDPTHIFQVLKGYLQIEAARFPDEVFMRGAARAEQAGVELCQAIAAMPGGWLKAFVARAMVHRFRELGGLRESPKFAIIRRMGIFRDALLSYARDLVSQGVFDAAEDILFLHMTELKALAKAEARDWRTLVEERRAIYRREMRRKRVPRVLLSDGSAFYDAPASAAAEDDDHVLSGSPVSAGTVEGVVHVIFDPHSAQLAPGEILVCPATDPAWTPLFLSAGGLVMELGGMITHGSVVAREYGIPAVVGVRQATERLKSGQRVRVDGASGQVTILDG